ncbi:zf-TFIIB domain-containing protein [Haloarcula sp. GH36]|uniref:TFIIB-type zinc ribbon-containing protein n=1 Tax=Haloarcula montana TaxID=3111776 RepID=UPI002D7932D7|nr:zf-TFIIB domain-containing protein [Haloarcula sp. GH36]
MDSNRELACPQCDTPFEQRKVQGVVVDFCLTCGGVWLDPGELQELTGYKRHATHSTHDDIDEHEHEDDDYRFDVEDGEVEDRQDDSDGGLLGFVADAIDGAGDSDGDGGGGGGWGGGGDGGGGGGGE